MSKKHSLHPPPPFCWGKGWWEGGFEPASKFSKRGGDLTGSQFLEGGCCERGGDLFQGGCSFYIKNKLIEISEIFNEKYLNKNVFLCHNQEFKLGNFNKEFCYF